MLVDARNGFNELSRLAMIWTVRPSLNGFVWDYPCPPCQVSKSGGSGTLSPFYENDAAFDGSAQRSAQFLKLLTRRGPDWGYFPEPDKYLFILDTPGQ